MSFSPSYTSIISHSPSLGYQYWSREKGTEKAPKEIIQLRYGKVSPTQALMKSFKMLIDDQGPSSKRSSVLRDPCALCRSTSDTSKDVLDHCFHCNCRSHAACRKQELLSDFNIETCPWCSINSPTAGESEPRTPVAQDAGEPQPTKATTTSVKEIKNFLFKELEDLEAGCQREDTQMKQLKMESMDLKQKVDQAITKSAQLEQDLDKATVKFEKAVLRIKELKQQMENAEEVAYQRFRKDFALILGDMDPVRAAGSKRPREDDPDDKVQNEHSACRRHVAEPLSHRNIGASSDDIQIDSINQG